MSELHPVLYSISQLRCLPYRMRYSLLKRVCRKRLPDYRFTVTMEGGLRCSCNLVNYIDRLIFFCGAHEKYMLHFLRDVVTILKSQGHTPISFMDIGANIGNHTLFMAKHVDQVYAFEPFTQVRERLEHHIQMNDLKNVQVFPFALGEENTQQEFYAASQANLGTASFCADHHRNNAPSGKLEIRHADAVVEAEALRKIDLIKLDVEGFEPPVLRGLKATLERDRPLLVVELSPTTRMQIGSEAALESMFPNGYRLYAFEKGCIESGKYRLAPFSYTHPTRIEDVIAIPEELVKSLKL